MAEPKDFNLAIGYLQAWKAYYEGWLDWQEASGRITNVEKSEEGELKTLKGGMYLDGRLKIGVNPNFAISFGVGYIYMSASGSSKLNASYQDVSSGINSEVTIEFSDELKASAIIPGVALHLITPLNEAIGAEIWGGVGYLMAKVEADQNQKGDYNNDLNQWEKAEVSLYQDGSGKGLAYNFGGRINVNLASNVSFFVGAEYLYAKLKELKGDGNYKEVYSKYTGFSDTDTESWTDSEWKVGNASVWGNLVNLAANGEQVFTNVLRSMELNLSGIRVLFGFALMF